MGNRKPGLSTWYSWEIPHGWVIALPNHKRMEVATGKLVPVGPKPWRFRRHTPKPAPVVRPRFSGLGIPMPSDWSLRRAYLEGARRVNADEGIRMADRHRRDNAETWHEQRLAEVVREGWETLCPFDAIESDD